MNATIDFQSIKQHKKPKTQSIEIQKRIVQTSSAIFDPETSTPPSDFMNTLKSRMNIYFPVASGKNCG
jgi:hypothetical protein